MPRETPVPEHRVSRLWHLGRLVGGLAGGVIGEAKRQPHEEADYPRGAELRLSTRHAERCRAVSVALESGYGADLSH